MNVQPGGQGRGALRDGDLRQHYNIDRFTFSGPERPIFLCFIVCCRKTFTIGGLLHISPSHAIYSWYRPSVQQGILRLSPEGTIKTPPENSPYLPYLRISSTLSRFYNMHYNVKSIRGVRLKQYPHF